MSVRYGFPFFLLFFWRVFPSYSQSFNFKHYTANDGLVSSTVYNSFQDSKGFLWFCTDAGVSRFDGKHFEKFSGEEGLSDNEVFKMYEDQSGRIWFLTYNGRLTLLDSGRFITPSQSPVLASMTTPSGFYNVFEDSQGRLFFISYKGEIVALIGSHVDRILLFNKKGETAGMGLTELFEDSRNKIWMLNSDAGCTRPDLLTARKMTNMLILNQNQYRFISPGVAFLLSQEGIAQMDQDRERLLIPKSRLGANPEEAKLFVDAKRNVFVSLSGGGVSMFKAADHYQHAPVHLLAGKNVSSVFQDRFSNYWFTTLGDGIYFLPSGYERQQNYSIAEGLSSNDVTALYKDGTGAVWLGFGNGAVNKLHPTGALEKIKEGNAVNHYCRVKKIQGDREGNIWIVADRYVANVRSGTSRMVLYGPAGESWKDLSVSPITGLPLIAASNGIFQAVPGSGDSIRMTKQNQFKNERMFALDFDAAGTLYLSSASGLQCFDGTAVTPYLAANHFKDRVNDFCRRDSLLFVATDGNGVFLFDEGRQVQHITAGQGLSSGLCRKIVLENKNAWVVTNLGLNKISFQDAFRYTITRYHSNALLSNDIRGLIVADESIYIGTDKGLCVIHGTLDGAGEQPIQFYFTSVASGQKSFNVDDPVSFPYSNQPIIIKYIGLDYLNPELISYQYRLSGEQQDWITTGNDLVEFLQLHPGTYQFELRASGYGTDWSPVKRLRFTVLPLWWQTAAFKILTAFILLAASFLAVRGFLLFRLRRQRETYERRHAIEQERNRISSDLHDDLGSGLTQIAILSRLAKNGSPPSESDANVLGKIASLSDEMLNKIGEIIWAINPSNDSLKNLIGYLHEFARNYFEKSNIQLEVRIPSQVPDTMVSSNFRRNVFLIVKEVLQNILKHANANRVKLFIHTDEKLLVIVIQDDGKGMNDALFSGSDPGLFKNGMRNLRRRAALLNGDLKMEALNGNGTKVFFSGTYVEAKISLSSSER